MAKYKVGERVRVFWRGSHLLTEKEHLQGFPGTIKGYNYVGYYTVMLDDGALEETIHSDWIESLDHPETTFRSIIRDLSEAPAMKRRFSLRFFCSEKAGFYETKYPDSLFQCVIIIRDNGLVEFEEYMHGEELAEIAKASIAARDLYEKRHGKEVA